MSRLFIDDAPRARCSDAPKLRSSDALKLRSSQAPKLRCSTPPLRCSTPKLLLSAPPLRSYALLLSSPLFFVTRVSRRLGRLLVFVFRLVERRASRL